MSAVFRVELLPAREGDCIILTYGDDARPRRIMIDAGRKATWRAVRARLAALPREERTFELLIVSHVDRDHIEGVVEMLSDAELALSFRDIWFNGYHHLQGGDLETFGPVQGERLTELLRRPGVRWNARFRGRSVEVGRVRRPITLAGGLRLTLLSPRREDLAALIPEWDAECRKAGLVKDVKGWREPPPVDFERMGALDVDALAATPFTADPSAANATSIAVLAELDGRRVLLAADGSAKQLAAALRPLAAGFPGGRLPLEALKLPHHGSRNNLSAELLSVVSCSRFLVSSNGSYFDHPHPETLARILTRGQGVELVFNYRSPEALAWDDDALKRRWSYRATYPAKANQGTIGVNLLP